MATAVFDKNQDCVYAIEKLWQWDYGRKLRIQGLSLPDAVEIQFSLQETGGEATPRIGLTRDGVTDVVIPDFIAEGDGATANHDAYAFIYLTDDTSGRTIKKIKMRVQARSKPEGYGGGGSTTMADILMAVNEAIATGGATDEQIAAAVKSYLDANPIEEQDPTVPGWAKAETKPTYTAVEVGADPVGTADAKVAAHNTATDAHNDIRLLIDGLTTRLNALADSDDTTLDQMSEVVAYIKSNKSLIDAITTNKVSVSDIIDNLTTNVSNKPLSAAQGVALKALIDAIVIPTTLPNPNALTIKQGESEITYDGSGAVTVTIPEGSDGKSAYQYAVEGGYTGTEAEFAAKLAAEKFANPNALTFTGAVSGSYDGSAPVSVDIPSGGVGGSAGSSEYELLCDQSFDLDGTGTSVEVQLPASPKGFVLYLAIQVNSPATSDTMTFSVDGANVPSYFECFSLTTSRVTVKKWFCDNIVTHNLMYQGNGDSNDLPIPITMVRGNITHYYLKSHKGDGKLVVGVPGKVGTLYIRAYMRY